MAEIRSVRRACQMFLDVAASSTGLSAKEVSVRHGLNISTTYHLLNSLSAEKLLCKGEDGRYKLGENAWALARFVDSGKSCPPAYVDAMHRLVSMTGESAYVSGWRNSRVEILEALSGVHPLTVADLTPGYSAHPHTRASCKVLFAHLPDEKFEVQMNLMTFEPITEFTITDPERFREEIALVRERGYALDDQEYFPGVVCISAPIRAKDVVVAACTISMPRDRFLGQEDAIIGKLLSAVADVE